MLVFWDQRLVFLATPKTGSTAIAAALEPFAAMSVQRPPVLKHTTARRYHRFIGPYLQAAAGERFTTVALMREPFDWLGSWYRFRRREAVLDAHARTDGMSFDDFARAYCRKPQPGFANVGAQARFLAPEGFAPVDRIFRYEDMEDFVAFLSGTFGRAIAVPRLNVSPPAETALAAETAAMLRVAMAADLALYATLG
jgi:hypothetical protein